MQTASFMLEEARIPGLELVDAAREVVDKPEQGVVDDPLIGEGGLDVPPHRLAEDTLDLKCEPALRARTALERLVGAHRPEALGQAPRRREVACATVDGGPQLRVDVVNGKLLLVGHFGQSLRPRCYEVVRRPTAASTSSRTSSSKPSVGCQPNVSRAFRASPTRWCNSAGPRFN